MKLSDYAKQVGISYRAAWNWYTDGKIRGYQSPTGTIIITELDETNTPNTGITVIYARVSSHKQKDDLDRQVQRVQDYCASNGWQVGKIVKEIASGVNDDRPKLNALLTDPKVSRIVAEHKDRLTRAGFNYIHQLLSMQGREVVVINLADTDDDDLLADLASIVNSYCARLYGIRRAKNKADLVAKVLQQDE